MKTVKQKYVPCELSVLKFNVEKGFAASDPSQRCNSFIGGLTSQAIVFNQYKTAQQEDFQTDHYEQQGDWFGSSSNQ